MNGAECGVSVATGLEVPAGNLVAYGEVASIDAPFALADATAQALPGTDPGRATRRSTPARSTRGPAARQAGKHVLLLRGDFPRSLCRHLDAAVAGNEPAGRSGG